MHLTTILWGILIMNRKFKILKISHIAIAVNNNNSALSLFNLLGMNASAAEFVENEKVNVVKIKPENKDLSIELLEPSDEFSAVRKFIDKKGEGLHHIALEVDNIVEAINYLIDNNIKLVYNSPKRGADNKLITFISPKSTPGVLLELCQSP